MAHQTSVELVQEAARPQYPHGGRFVAVDGDAFDHHVTFDQQRHEAVVAGIAFADKQGAGRNETRRHITNYHARLFQAERGMCLWRA